MYRPPLTVERDPVDESVDETFPASDAPAWTPTHAGSPVRRPLPLLAVRDDLRSVLREDVERLSRTVGEVDARRRTREALVSDAMLAAGRAVVREPIDDSTRVRTVECEQAGTVRDASCVVVGARYDADDVSGAATLLALVRGLAATSLQRSVRFVAFANAGRVSGSSRYAERLWTDGVGVRAMVSLAQIDLKHDRDPTLLVVGNLPSSTLVHEAGKAFRSASHIRVRTVALPSWLPGVRASDQAAFWDHRWPAMMVTDRAPWRTRNAGPPNVDRIAAALPGLIAVVQGLAGVSV